MLMMINWVFRALSLTGTWLATSGASCIAELVSRVTSTHDESTGTDCELDYWMGFKRLLHSLF